MHFGEQLKKFRELKNISQKELADLLDSTQQNIVYLEKREYIKPLTKKKIEEKIGFKLDSLNEAQNENYFDSNYYKKQAAIHKEQYEHCLRMIEIFETNSSTI